MSASDPAVEPVVELTREQSIKVAAWHLKEALEYLADGDNEHAAVWIESALAWMGAL